MYSFFFNINTTQHQEDLVFVFSVTDIGDKRIFLSLRKFSLIINYNYKAIIGTFFFRYITLHDEY